MSYKGIKRLKSLEEFGKGIGKSTQIPYVCTKSFKKDMFVDQSIVEYAGDSNHFSMKQILQNIVFLTMFCYLFFNLNKNIDLCSILFSLHFP